MSADLPTGTITFLFTDIERSTQLWEQYPDVMRLALARHDVILRENIEANQGYLVKITGDGGFAAFANAINAVNACVAIQHALTLPLIENQPPAFAIKIRMGLHTGEAELRNGDYFGQTLNRTARIMSAGHGGQILLSTITANLVRGQLSAGESLLDLGEHALKGLSQPEKICQFVGQGLGAEFPALNAIATAINNLPAQLTSFIGRKREINETKEKLAATRLLTLIGPGGTGKTRLSLQLGAQVLADFVDGVWLIELAPLADPAFILETISSVLGLRPQLGMPLKEVVADYLRGKKLLLIFDNCEHLIEACAQLANDFLLVAPGVKIVASSREALGINGETIYRVASLSLPSANQMVDLSGFESIQLFVERARVVNPKFELTEKNAPSIAQICRRLDGIPLAIELAAARVNVFSAEQIAARLDDRFKLLTGGSRTALPRQQTLRALIDWSYDNLNEDERALLRRLSVFAGGWTLEATESMFSELDVLTLLPQLVNKSLVVMDDESGETRYHLLETIRQYARDKLLDAGESSQIRTLHLNFYLQLAQDAVKKIGNPFSAAIIDISDAEYDNLRAAFEWALDHNVSAALKLVETLVGFWFSSGHGGEGIRWANDALARADELPIPDNEQAVRQQMSERLNALSGVAWLHYSQGDNLAAIKASAQGIELARQLDDKKNLTTSLTLFGSAKTFISDMDGGRASLEEAVAIARESTDKFGLGMALGMLAMVVSLTNNDFSAGKAYENEALATFQANEKTWDAIVMAFGSIITARVRGEFDVARERCNKLLPIFEQMGDQHRINMIYSDLAHMDRYEGKYDAAEKAYRKTIIAWQKLGHRAAIAHQLESFAFVAQALAQFERAIHLFGAAEALREKINIPMSPREKMEYDHQLENLRTQIDEKSFTNHYNQGHAMPMEQAIAYAVGETNE